MSETQISANNIAQWETLDNIAASLEKRGLKPRPSLDRENGCEDELLVEIEENKYIALVDAAPGDDPSDYNKFQSSTVPTTFVSTHDFQTFSVIRRKRIIGGDKHGRLDRQKFSFNKDQITSGDRYSVLDKLNDINYGDDSSLDNLFDTRQVVDDFYEEFESIRTDLITEVEGIPDDRGDAKQRYVQVTLNRLIFLHFIQEKGLLGAGEDDYLLTKHDEFAADGDVQTDFYEPLFFKALAEKGFQTREFDRVPYLNGGLFSETPIEQNFENARLGANAKESNDLYRRILEFLDGWNWHVDERLDVVEPKNLSPAVLGHIFEQSVNQKEIGAYYTPEEITSFMSRKSIYSRILNALNEATGANYEEIDAVFGLGDGAAQGESDDAVATDGGAITQQAAVDAASADHIETLYFDVLKDLHVLDPAVGSGAFLLAAQDVLLDIFLHAIEYFEQLYEEQPFAVSERVKNELAAVSETGSKTLHAKRAIILNNLYGVDIDDGAVEICKLRLWLSMVADIEDDPSAVDPLPNINFNIRQGNSLIGFTELVEVSEDGDKKLTNYGGGVGEAVRERYEDVIEATENHRAARTKPETKRWHDEAERRRAEHAAALNQKVLDNFHAAGFDDIDIEELHTRSPFHWVIEFPTVYDSGGFDIVIGNPPYRKISAELSEVINPDVATDLYTQFITRGQDILRNEGYMTYITPTSWETGPDFGTTRSNLLDSGHLQYLANLPYDVFEDAYVDTAIFVWQATSGGGGDYCEVIDFSGTRRDPMKVIQNPDTEAFAVADWQDLGIVVTDKDWISLYNRVGDGLTIGDVSKSTRGVLVTDEAIASDSAETPIYYPDRNESYQRFERIGANTQAEWDLLDERPPYEYYEGDRMLVRRLVSRDDRLLGTVATDEFVTDKNTYIFKSESQRGAVSEKFLLGVLNSAFISWWLFNVEMSASKDDFRQVTLTGLRNLPHPQIADEERQQSAESHDNTVSDAVTSFIEDEQGSVTALVEELDLDQGATPRIRTAVECGVTALLRLHTDRQEINLTVSDYLEASQETVPLSDMGSVNRLDSAADSPVNETVDQDKLRMVDAHLESNPDGSVTLSVEVERKPPDAGRGDYESLGKIDVLRISGLPDDERALLEVFLPYAIANPSVVDGFKTNAATTITLLDRLENERYLSVPAVDSVKEGLEQYKQVRSRAEDIDAQIERAERLLDAIVYGMYGLTDREIQIIKDSV